VVCIVVLTRVRREPSHAEYALSRNRKSAGTCYSTSRHPEKDDDHLLIKQDECAIQIFGIIANGSLTNATWGSELF
jgi:hypothetical protein